MKEVEWTIKTYAIYNEALRAKDAEFAEERDRRYRELEKTKQDAHDNALRLAREIQTYKDEQANELREQINSERLIYARKSEVIQVQDKYDAILKPLLEFVASKQGAEKGVDKTLYYILILIGLAISIYGIYM